MKIYTVSFFGSRKIDRHYELDAILMKIIEDLLMNKDYVEFLVGREGEFDLEAADL